tara:strand:+ start:317 stop:1174 length:858 start_codon:yes stop_codon:yes gene_type:complete
MKKINKNKKAKKKIDMSYSQTKSFPAMMIVKTALLGAFMLIFFGSITAQGASDVATPPKANWSFKGPFGVFKRDQLQRGFQVYKEVCAVCHGLDLVRYDKLAALGFSEEEIKAIAGEYEVPGPLNEDGEPTTIKATPGDAFANPYPNSNAARAANNGSFPPDLSLMSKARANGADYIRAILTGYEAAPDDFGLMDGMYYNRYFSGKQIAMSPPLADNQVDYSDGTPATIEHMSEDVSAFLAWAAEPELEIRRNLGVKVMIFLSFFTLLMYCLMRRTWRKIKYTKK